MRKRKKKIKFKGLLFLLLILYLIIMSSYYLLNRKVKTVIITGNNILDSNNLKKTIKINKDTKLWQISKINLKNKLKKNSLIKGVNLNISLDGVLKINIIENKILFYNLISNAYVLENKKEVKLNNLVLGIPTLINYVPKDIYADLILKMSKINPEIISYISEIEYSPDAKDNIIFDKYRFILKMNDQNKVYINISNFAKLNKYQELYLTTISNGENKKGIFYLDSSIKDTVLFSSYESLQKEAEGKNVKLP